MPSPSKEPSSSWALMRGLVQLGLTHSSSKKVLGAAQSAFILEGTTLFLPVLCVFTSRVINCPGFPGTEGFLGLLDFQSQN